MGNSVTGKEMIIKDVRLAFTKNLFVARSYKDQKDKPKKYQCQLLISKDHPQLQDVKNEILRLATEAWKEAGPQVIKSISGNKQKFAFLDGDLATYEGFPGNFSINASRKEEDGKPLFLLANPGTKDAPNLATEADLKSGYYVNVKISFWAYENEGKGMNCNLLAMQLNRKGEAFSGGGVSGASADEFGNVEEAATVGAGAFDAFS